MQWNCSIIFIHIFLYRFSRFLYTFHVELHRCNHPSVSERWIEGMWSCFYYFILALSCLSLCFPLLVTLQLLKQVNCLRWGNCKILPIPIQRFHMNNSCFWKKLNRGHFDPNTKQWKNKTLSHLNVLFNPFPSLLKWLHCCILLSCTDLRFTQQITGTCIPLINPLIACHKKII